MEPEDCCSSDFRTGLCVAFFFNILALFCLLVKDEHDFKAGIITGVIFMSIFTIVGVIVFVFYEYEVLH